MCGRESVSDRTSSILIVRNIDKLTMYTKSDLTPSNRL